MIIKIKVFPGARKPRIIEDGNLVKVYVNAPAVDGKANSAVIVALAAYYKIRKSRIEILKGHKSREKTIAVNIWEIFAKIVPH